MEQPGGYSRPIVDRHESVSLMSIIPRSHPVFRGSSATLSTISRDAARPDAEQRASPSRSRARPAGLSGTSFDREAGTGTGPQLVSTARRRPDVPGRPQLDRPHPPDRRPPGPPRTGRGGSAAGGQRAPATAELRLLDPIRATDDFADPPQVDGLHLPGLASSLARQVFVNPRPAAGDPAAWNGPSSPVKTSKSGPGAHLTTWYQALSATAAQAIPSGPGGDCVHAFRVPGPPKPPVPPRLSSLPLLSGCIRFDVADRSPRVRGLDFWLKRRMRLSGDEIRPKNPEMPPPSPTRATVRARETAYSPQSLLPTASAPLEP